MNIMYPKDYLVWDLETTGFSPVADRILEISCLKIKNGKEVGAFNTLLNNKMEIPEGAFKVHGISAQMCEMEGVDPKAGLVEILRLLSEYPFHVTHNGIKFDIPFILQSLWRENIVNSSAYENINRSIYSKAIDTAVIVKAGKLNLVQLEDESFLDFARRVMDFRAFGVKYNLGLACDEMGIDRSKVTQHRATADVYLTNEVYKKLIGV